MNNVVRIPLAINETVLQYAPGSAEKKSLKAALAEGRSAVIDIPMYINGQEVRTTNIRKIAPPHDHQHTIATFHKGDGSHVQAAIEAALQAKEAWELMPWENRASIFLKAADLMAGPYRATLNAATMLGQSKNAFQAEIDAACEMIDFLRFNVQFMQEIYNDQPLSSKGIFNRVEYRPLEGFCLAVTPFNFTAIAGNLPTSMAMMGNVVVWKAAETQIYAANILMKIFIEAGLPAGVINLIYVDGPTVGEHCFNHPMFTGLHFTGSSSVFKGMLKNIYSNLDLYKSFPRFVGETGGKDFIVIHPSAKVEVAVANTIRGAFEYQGQKCSAASRAYVPQSMWKHYSEEIKKQIATIKVGPVEDFRNFVNAVISEKAFTKITSYIDAAKKDTNNVEILCGGTYDKSKGYFIDPTILVAKKPDYITMCEEIFGPVLTLYIYQDEDFDATLKLVDATSPYALTGAILSQDRDAIERAKIALRNSAGNFYINDKPTGAVVGQQPFGGGRGSGTNDKAGSKINLLRWASVRTIKETLVPAVSYGYDFLLEE
ncbi:MAG: L-glutamate gamma-semialdehyde dehydrogenase [Bacteroidetes bacterium]|nr:L-glutamate gamma-semialdehyde dehydrogenase [Bacteroidota bacterium]